MLAISLTCQMKGHFNKMVNSANNFISPNIAGVKMHISYTVSFQITAISQDGNLLKCWTKNSNSNAKWPPLSYTKRLFDGLMCQLNQTKGNQNKQGTRYILGQGLDTANFCNNFSPFYLIPGPSKNNQSFPSPMCRSHERYQD